MPYAVGLDCVGTDNPIVVEGVPVEGDYLEISWDDYTAAINCLLNGRHVCVVDDMFVLDYEIPPEDSP
jgi:hypothetical protein